jgi:hypothetical protein
MLLNGILCKQSLSFGPTRRADALAWRFPSHCKLLAPIPSDNPLGALNGQTRKEVSCTLSPPAA